MNSTDKRRLLVILVVLACFGLPLLINGPLTPDEDTPMVPLGLDLRGGVDVQISVDTDYQERALLDTLRFEINTQLRSVLGGGGSTLRSTGETEEPGLRLTLDNPGQDANAVAEMLDGFVRRGDIQDFDRAALATSRGVVLRFNPTTLRSEVDEAIQQASRIVKERVDALGVAQSDVRVEGGNRIRVQLPGQRDPSRVINNLVRPATLEFRLVYPDEAGARMESVLEQLIDRDGTVRPGARIPDGWIVMPGLPDRDERVRATQFIGEQTIETPRGPETREVAWYLVRADADVRGEHLRTVRAEAGGTFGNEMVVSFELNSEGTRRFRDVTEAHAPTPTVEHRLAIVLEGTVRSAPRIAEAIPGGRGQISGGFSFEEARDLENILKTGALPARLVPGEMSVVGASLGEDSIRSGIRASLLGGVLVFAFMLWYYATGGVIAVISLILNVFLVLGVLSMMRATLTLPGIAGIILTIGMAVDANVLIYERIREEIRAGKSLRNAIGLGFDRAFSAIMDANVTTLVTSLVLLQFGFGPIRGFALTMTFGIFATLFTGLFVTQALLGVFFSLHERLNLGAVQWFRDPHFNWVGSRWPAYIVSLVLIAASIGHVPLIGGPRLGVDFTGGVQTEIAATADIGRGGVETALLAAGFEAPRVQIIERSVTAAEVETQAPGGAVEEDASSPEAAPATPASPDAEPVPPVETEEETSVTPEAAAVPSVPEVETAPVAEAAPAVTEIEAPYHYLIRVPNSDMAAEAEGQTAIVGTEHAIVEAVRQAFPEATITAVQTRGVSPETGARLRTTAIGLSIVAALGIFIYIAVRFTRVYSVAALVAVAHDAIVAWGVGSMLGVNLSLDVVAALLTIMGYSINDTIVVFDRIRENGHAMQGKSYGDIVNISLNQTLSRTVITSGVTLLTVLALVLLGGPGVYDFSLTLLIGFIAGAYSTAFVAAPLVWGWTTRGKEEAPKSA